MFLLELIFKTMKKILIYIAVAVVMFSCKKDVEHQWHNSYPILSTQPVLDIDDTGVTFVGSIKQNGKEPIVDHGFVWSVKENPTKKDSHISLGALNNDKDFQTRIVNDLKPNQTYYVKAYIATNDYVVYGDEKKFISLGSSPPIIERLEPSEITCYINKITVYGKNFCSDKADIKINLWDGYILSVSTDSIVIGLSNIIIGTNTFELSVFDKTVLITFEAVGLIIESIEPQPAEIGSIVSIRGRHLKNIREIRLSGTLVEILEMNDTEVKIKIPVVKEGLLTLKITDTKGFNYNLTIDILSPWKSIELPFILHNNVFCNYLNKLYTLNNMSVYQLDMQNRTNQSIAKMPEEPLWKNTFRYFIIGSKFYICTQSDLFLSYDIATDTWEKLPSYTHIIPRMFNDPVLCFSIGDKGYVVSYCSTFNKNTLIEYDSSSRTWKEKSDVTYIFSPWFWNNATVTTFNGKAYISAMDRIWEFDSQTYLFQELFMAETGHWTGAAQLFTYNDKIYKSGSIYVEYDPATNQTKQLPQLVFSSSVMFIWENFLFVSAYSNNNNEYLVFDLSLVEK